MLLVLNTGSSSVKYKIFDSRFTPTSEGQVDRIGDIGGPPDHASALTDMLDHIAVSDLPLIGVGHRVVHGGDRFTEATVVTDEVRSAIDGLSHMAPLHTAAALTGIDTIRERRPDLPNVAVFDTAFHTSLPSAAAVYALENAVATTHGIRRYGFHGISFASATQRTAALLRRPSAQLNMIILHLGNGASACAVRGGLSVETSMGFTPLEGLVMGTRCGDLDPAVVTYLHRVAGYRDDELDDLLNRRSGLHGLCGDHDMRRILTRHTAGDEEATLALDVYCHRIRKYIGAYAAVLGRIDAITFTGGVGEHAAEIRARALDSLSWFGVEIDDSRNRDDSNRARIVSPDGTSVAVCVVPTDEEYAIAVAAGSKLGTSPPSTSDDEATSPP